MKHGLWFSIGDYLLAEKIESSIWKNGSFTTTVNSSEVKPREAELIAVSRNGSHVDYIGISKWSRRVATGQVTISISNLIELHDLSCKHIKDALPKTFASRFHPPQSGIWRPSPRLWEEILQAICKFDDSIADGVSGLKQRIHSTKVKPRSTKHGFEIDERDAVGIAIQAWGGSESRKRIFGETNPMQSDKRAPFLSQIPGFKPREDLLIHHDQRTFPDLVPAQSDIIGAVDLYKPSSTDKLTIVECNRQPLEETLGVDLIYYNHRCDSFVLVQYKRLSKKSGTQPEYRPVSDKSHDNEVKRMGDADQLLCSLHDFDPDVVSYRLSEHAFYVKLCKSDPRPSLDTKLVSGMYFPLELWKRYLSSDYTKGTRGGIVFTWDRCPKHITNTDFTKLLGNGWIGTRGTQSEVLQKIIEQVLDSGRMLILAGTSPEHQTSDYQRDAFGQFKPIDHSDIPF